MALTQISTEGIKNGTITGSDLATNIDLVDNQKLRLGASNDLQIYHDGTNSYIQDTGTGALVQKVSGLKVRSTSDEMMIQALQNNQVELYYDGSKKFETTSSGVKFTGVLEAVDNQSILLGTSQDFRIRHTGSHSQITDEGTGNLRLGSNATVIADTSFSETQAKFIQNGAVELYHDNTKRFETSATGIDITGKIKATSNIEINTDNTEFRVGASDDFKISHSSSENINILRSDSPTVFRNHANNETLAKLTPNGSVELYHDNSKKFETNNVGVQIYGDLNFSDSNANDIHLRGGKIYGDDGAINTLEIRSTSGNVNHARISIGEITNSDNGGIVFYGAGSSTADKKLTIRGTTNTVEIPDNHKFVCGDGSDLRIFHDGSKSVIDDNFGELQIRSEHIIIEKSDGSETYIDCQADGAVELYHNNSKKFETTSYGNLSAGQVRVSASNASTVAFSAGDVGTGFYNSGSNAIGYSANGTQKWNIGSGGHITLLDSTELRLGTDADLKIYHNGSGSYIDDSSGTGELILKSNSISFTNAAENEYLARFFQDSGVELYNNGTKKFATGGSGVYHDNNGTLSQNAIHFERGQNTGDYSTIFGVTNYPDASGYGDQDDGYWAAVHSKGGMVVVLNTDGGRNDGRNNHDHFSIYTKANNSSSGKRAFSVDHTGGIQCGKAGINIDREWENQPSFSMTRDCNDGTNNTDNNAYFRFHGTGRTHAQWTGGSSGNDFSANMLLDGGNYNASDRRAKTDIVDCPYGLDVVNKLKPRKYQLVNSQLEPQGDDNINLGFIAQEIMEHIPECVNYLGDKANTPNEKGFARAYALDTNEIVAVLTKAIQELAAKVAVLESKT